jgi:hypothetical protein
VISDWIGNGGNREAFSMGYDIHITRASDWSESETRPISIEEWLAYVASDPEMRLDNYAQVEIDGHVLRHESEGIAVWTTYSGHGVNGNMAWFNYSDGQVQVARPDREILGKMLQIANRLGVKVQGDDGEEYLRTEDLPAEEQIQKVPRRPWWRIW